MPRPRWQIIAGEWEGVKDAVCEPGCIVLGRALSSRVNAVSLGLGKLIVDPFCGNLAVYPVAGPCVSLGRRYIGVCADEDMASSIRQSCAEAPTVADTWESFLTPTHDRG